MSGVSVGYGPYRTSAKPKDEHKIEGELRHYKAQLNNVEVIFVCDDGKGGIRSYSQLFKADEPPDEKEFNYGSTPTMFDGGYHYYKFLTSSSKRGYLFFESAAIPWHRFIKAEVVKTISNTVEFDWIKKND